MQIMLGVSLIIAFTVLGSKYSKRYKLRRDFFSDLYQFNNMMTAEMSFGRRTIGEVYKSANFRNAFSVMLENYLEGKGVSDAENILTLDEHSYLVSYFAMLGKSDALSQQKTLSSAEPQLKRYSNDSAEKAAKYGALSVRLSFLFGLMAFILVI